MKIEPVPYWKTVMSPTEKKADVLNWKCPQLKKYIIENYILLNQRNSYNYYHCFIQKFCTIQKVWIQNEWEVDSFWMSFRVKLLYIWEIFLEGEFEVLFWRVTLTWLLEVQNVFLMINFDVWDRLGLVWTIFGIVRLCKSIFIGRLCENHQMWAFSKLL